MQPDNLAPKVRVAPDLRGSLMNAMPQLVIQPEGGMTINTYVVQKVHYLDYIVVVETADGIFIVSRALFEQAVFTDVDSRFALAELGVEAETVDASADNVEGMTMPPSWSHYVLMRLQMFMRMYPDSGPSNVLAHLSRWQRRQLRSHLVEQLRAHREGDAVDELRKILDGLKV